MNRSASLSRGLVLQCCRCLRLASSWLVAAVAAIAIKRHKSVEVRPTLADNAAFAPICRESLQSARPREVSDQLLGFDHTHKACACRRPALIQRGCRR